MSIENFNFKIKNIESSLAQRFWQNSNESTFFTNPKYITLFEKKIDWWLVSKGNEDLCLWPICSSKDNEVFLPSFGYYFGPIWSNKYINSADHKKLTVSNRVFDLFLEKFKSIYKNLIFQTHFTHHDLRFFLWHNNNNEKKFLITPRYSSVICDLNKKTDEEIFLDFRELRRRMIRKAKKNENIIKTVKFNYEEIIKLYCKTLEDKNHEIKKDTLKKIKTYYDLCNKGEGKMLGFRNKKNNELISFLLLTFSKEITNLILNLSTIEGKNSGITALTIFDAIKYSKNNGKNFFDFNGANSPIGADDKQSYGGGYSLYFEIELSNR